MTQTMNGPLAAWWPYSFNRRAASVRLRCISIVEGLRKLGYRAELYTARRTIPRVLVLSKRYDPDTQAHAQSLRRDHGTRIVLDICDNHFYNPDGSARWKERSVQLRSMMANSDLVIASTEALAQVIANECPQGPPIRVIGDAAEGDHTPPFRPTPLRLVAEIRLRQLRKSLPRDSVRLVWFGNHGSEYALGGMGDLANIKDEIERLARARPISLTVISNHRPKFNAMFQSWNVRCAYLAWNEATISRALKLHDIAVVPITPNPFTLCKTNNRVATALLHGLAVVGDAIPSYEPFSPVAVLDDWRAGLELYAGNPISRQAAIQAGQAFLKENWSPAVIWRQWIDAIQSA